MKEDIAYPTEDMISVSHDLRPFIEEQWGRHTALFMSNQDSFSDLLKFIARLVPNGGGKAGELANALTEYHKQYHDAYLALHDLADKIENAAQTMTSTDQSVSQSFQDLPR